VLGFRFVGELRESGPAFERLLRVAPLELHAALLEREGVRVKLQHFASPGACGDGTPRAPNQLGLSHLSLRVEALGSLLADLRRRGVRVLEETLAELPERGARAAFVADPDGTLIELVEQPGD
jgi:catechol 2,3-dioxygenase-like lactoylglutathione lyase family enzyme